jgi:hypothetical protein
MERRRNKTRCAADEAIRGANKQIDNPLLVPGSTVKVFINVTTLPLSESGSWGMPRFVLAAGSKRASVDR